MKIHDIVQLLKLYYYEYYLDSSLQKYFINHLMSFFSILFFKSSLPYVVNNSEDCKVDLKGIDKNSNELQKIVH